MFPQGLDVADLEADPFERFDHRRERFEFSIREDIAIDEGRFGERGRFARSSRDRVVEQPALRT